MQKDTSKMLEELKACTEFERFYDENKKYTADLTLAEYIDTLLKEKNLSKAAVVKDAEMSEVYAYQIMSGLRIPDRKKLLCLAFGMKLDLEETQKMLKYTGYAPLYVKNTFDCIVIYGLCNGFTVPDVNEKLYDFGLETLG